MLWSRRVGTVVGSYAPLKAENGFANVGGSRLSGASLSGTAAFEPSTITATANVLEL